MLKKDITYVNFNGQSITKAFYFNITTAELALRELESDGTWSDALKTIQGSDKGSVVLPEFRKILKWTYGEKSEDGESFTKSDAIWDKFNGSEPWSILIMELLTNAGYAADFINAALPADIAARNREAQATNGFRPGADITPPTVQVTPAPPVQYQEAPVAQPYQLPVSPVIDPIESYNPNVTYQSTPRTDLIADV